jgi:hypothetical protein
MEITKEQAERAIEERVRLIDAMRASNAPDKEQAIAHVEGELRELKKVTGPRHIVGSSDIPPKR